MRSLFALFSLMLLLTSCGSGEKVDLQNEMSKRAALSLSWDDNGGAPEIQGSFCTATLCMDSGDIDWTTKSFTPYTRGNPLTISVLTDSTISEMSFQLKDAEGKTIQNNLDFEANGDKSFTITEDLKHSGQLFLAAKVRFDGGGYSQSYFGLDVE